jgi:hypothetical protein
VCECACFAEAKRVKENKKKKQPERIRGAKKESDDVHAAAPLRYVWWNGRGGGGVKGAEVHKCTSTPILVTV